MTGRTTSVDKTERLYEENAYLTRCGARVLAVSRIQDPAKRGTDETAIPAEDDGNGGAWEV